MLNKKNYFEHIDGLRCLAVLSVVLMHLGVKGFSGGFVGVDVFFVISGFLITGIIVREIEETGKFSFVNFYYRRARRILPALIFVLLFTFLTAIYFLDVGPFIAFGKSLAAAAFGVSNMHFSHQAGYFDIYSQTNPLLHTWSLGVEEQFYVFWPISLLLTGKISGLLGRKNKALFISLIIFVFLLSFSLNVFFYECFSQHVFYYAPTRAFELCIGAALVFLPASNKKKSISSEFLGVFGLLLVGASVFFFSDKTPFPRYCALLPTLGAALLIYTGSSSRLGKVFKLKPVRYIGLISYSLYLIHWPLIVFSNLARERLGLDVALPNEWMALILLTSILIAHIMYRYVEQPFRKKREASKKEKGKVLTLSLIIITLVASVGFSLQSYSLWGWRVDPQVANKKIYGQMEDYHHKNWGGAGFSGGYIYRGSTLYPKLVMLGDSHSDMLDEGVVKYLSAPLNLTTYSVAGYGGEYPSELLLPGLTKDKPITQQLYDNASRLAHKVVLEELRKSVNSVLLVSFSYARQLIDTEYIEDHRSIHVSPKIMREFSDYAPLINALDRLKAGMGSRKIVIIGDFPGNNYNVTSCLQLLGWFSNEGRCQKETPISQRQGQAHVNDVLKQYAQKRKRVYFIDPFNVFCQGEYCRNMDERKQLYYSDNNHLSKLGSKYFLKKVQAELIGIMNK